MARKGFAPFVALSMFCTLCAGAAPPFGYEEVLTTDVKTNRHSRVTYTFPEERIGCFTVKGERVGDGLVATNRFVTSAKQVLDVEDVVFHAAKCPTDLSDLSFECSDGELGKFWRTCLNLTKNRVIAKSLGDAALEARYAAVGRGDGSRWQGRKTADYSTGGIKRAFPILCADILGDWREKLVLPGDNGESLLIFTSPHETKFLFWSFMLDPVYRTQVAAWNTAYNQAPQTGFYFGSRPPRSWHMVQGHILGPVSQKRKDCKILHETSVATQSILS